MEERGKLEWTAKETHLSGWHRRQARNGRRKKKNGAATHVDAADKTTKEDKIGLKEAERWTQHNVNRDIGTSNVRKGN